MMVTCRISERALPALLLLLATTFEPAISWDTDIDVIQETNEIIEPAPHPIRNPESESQPGQQAPDSNWNPDNSVNQAGQQDPDNSVNQPDQEVPDSNSNPDSANQPDAQFPDSNSIPDNFDNEIPGSGSSEEIPSDPIRVEHLCWCEEFNDLSAWTHLVTGWRGGNGEFEYYRNNRNNSYIEDGILHIKPTLTADEFGDDFLETGTIDLNDNDDPDVRCNMEPCVISGGADIVNPIQSARMDSNASFTFKYGRVEVRAKMPRGDWIWPAIWMKPSHNLYGPWPISGEIDIAEVRSNRFMKNQYTNQSMGLNFTASTLHWGMNKTTDRWRLSTFNYTLKNPAADLSDDFHVYGMEWTEKYFRFSLDGVQYADFPIPSQGFWKYGGFKGESIWGDVNNAPFDDEYFFLLNVAVGGVFFPDGLKYIPCKKPWSRTDPNPMRKFWSDKSCWYDKTWDDSYTDFQLDYIRVYTYDNSICNVKTRNNVWK